MSIFEKFHQTLSQVIDNYQEKKARKSISVLDTDNIEDFKNILEEHWKKSTIQRNAFQLRLDVVKFVTKLPIDWWTEMLLLFTNDITLRKEIISILEIPEYAEQELISQGFTEVNKRQQYISDHANIEEVATLLEVNEKLVHILSLKTEQLEKLESELRIQKKLCTNVVLERDNVRIENWRLTAKNNALKQRLAVFEKKMATKAPKDIPPNASEERKNYTPPSLFKVN
jgi:hypothetical protein